MWSRPILRRAGKKSSKSQIGLGVSVTYASVSDLEVLIGRLKTVGKFVSRLPLGLSYNSFPGGRGVQSAGEEPYWRALHIESPTCV